MCPLPSGLVDHSVCDRHRLASSNGGEGGVVRVKQFLESVLGLLASLLLGSLKKELLFQCLMRDNQIVVFVLIIRSDINV